MLQRRKKIIVAVVCLLCVLSVSVIVSAAYLNTNRDTRKAPEASKSDLKITTDYQLIYETDRFEYYFRDDRDVIAIKEKNTGYVWKTGLDIPYKDQVEEAKEAVLSGDDQEIERIADRRNITVEQLKTLAETPVEESMNDTYISMANSLITVEYFDGSGDQMTKKKVSSAAKKTKEGTSAIQMVEGDTSTGLSNKWVLKVTMEKIDLGFNVYITLSDDGKISYDIPFKEIEGKGMDLLCTISITPFLGASGGLESYYNEEDQNWTDTQKKYMTPGYVLVPDGSGSLIRFTANTTKFVDYEGDVYGEDPATDYKHYDGLSGAVPIQNPLMPVFGISQGDGTQSAFVAYADSGDEYMWIIATPEADAKNQVWYTYAYAKFAYNFDYYQVTNQAGATYRKTRETPNEFDISITYSFLYGDGSDGEPKADYTGMAKEYRNHLMEQGVLNQIEQNNTDIPIRLDFLMADSKKGIMGTNQVTMTTTDDIDDILSALQEKGVQNINSGLIGWQKSGESLSKPNKAKYSRDIGTKKEISNLIAKYAEEGIDISLSREFLTINKSMISYYNNASKHTNTQYLTLNKAGVLPENSPVTSFGYALPTRSAEWMTDLYDAVSDFSNSFTIAGISNTLVSSHNSDGSETTVTDAIELYQKAVEEIKNDNTKINMVNPNAYFWKYTDRFLQSPVGTSQYVYETDTVPFLQMVLNGTMEMYAPYSNFSFYSLSDMLRMIDYNISPSFVLTENPSYMLASTISADYYSTEYDQYEELIQTIYNTVNEPLSQVIGYEWKSRTVVDDGVIVNTYAKGTSEKSIIINYTSDSYNYNGVNVGAQSAKVMEGGANE